MINDSLVLKLIISCCYNTRPPGYQCQFTLSENCSKFPYGFSKEAVRLCNIGQGKTFYFVPL